VSYAGACPAPLSYASSLASLLLLCADKRAREVGRQARLHRTRGRRPVGSVAGCHIRKRQQCRDADRSLSRSGGGRSVRRLARAGVSLEAWLGVATSRSQRSAAGTGAYTEAKLSLARGRSSGAESAAAACSRLETVVALFMRRFWHTARTPVILRAPVRRHAHRPETALQSQIQRVGETGPQATRRLDIPAT
jgi:hypothetical protein